MRATRWVQRLAAFLIGCLLLLTPISFWEAQHENGRIEREHAAAIQRDCAAGNQTKRLIGQILNVVEHLSPPDSPTQQAAVRRFQQQVAPLLKSINCRKVSK